MKRRTEPSRRRFFLQAGALAATPLLNVGPLTASPLARPPRRSAAEKLHIAGVGCGGKGWSDIAETSKGQQVVALCDVDRDRLDKAKATYAGATGYADWRKMLEQSDIDAVTISTPDHMHAAIAMAAMALGKHVYVQKPLTWSVFEARQLTLMARRQGVVTQMGNQHRSNIHWQGARDLVRSGVIGPVREAHVWTDRPIWPQGIDRPSGEDPIPDSLSWDLWLGVAPERPFKRDVYHDFKWRGFWDFGTGALGDMGCHLIDPVVWALRLPPPSRVSSVGPRPHADSAPKWSIVAYDFPGSGERPELRMLWYDGGAMPPAHLLHWPRDQQVPGNGALFIGDVGTLFVDTDRGPILLPQEQFADFEMPTWEPRDHYREWADACRGEGRCVSPFDEAGPLTETVLLGNVAYRLGRAIEWDAARLEVSNARSDAAPLLRRPYRKGWEVEWLPLD